MKHARVVHGVLSAIGFGLIFPLSLLLFYFGHVCKLSEQRKKYIHYIGFIAAALFGIVAFVFGVIAGPIDVVHVQDFGGVHSIIGIALLCVMCLGILIYSVMRRYRWIFMIWCDFIICFCLLCWSFTAICSGIYVWNEAHIAFELALIWFGVLLGIIIILSIDWYARQTQSQFSVVIIRGNEVTYKHDIEGSDDDDEYEEDEDQEHATSTNQTL